MKLRLTAPLVAALVLSSCSTQVLTNLASTTTSSVVTTTTIPAGDVRALLDQMLQNAIGLGDLIASGKKAEYRQRLQNVESINIGLEPQLKALNNDVDDDVARIVQLFRTAVNKKRPADADKAARFLPLVIDALG